MVKQHDLPLATGFIGTLADHQLNKFQNSVLLSPHANRDEVRNTLDGWFNDDLPDMNQDESEVARYEIRMRCGGSERQASTVFVRTQFNTCRGVSYAICPTLCIARPRGCGW